MAGGQDRLGKHLTIPSLQLQLGKSTEPALLVMVQWHVINIKMWVKCTRARSLKIASISDKSRWFHFCEKKIEAYMGIS